MACRDAEKEAVAARDVSEHLLARSLAAPRNPDADVAPQPLSLPETQSLWELAGHAGGKFSLLFLKEATGDPRLARQVRARSEPALIAAVGLDASRQEKALETE